MKRIIKTSIYFSIMATVLTLLLLSGCSQQQTKPRERVGSMDTPEFHVKRGDEALLSKQYENARSSYRQALSLDANYSSALSGMAAASAYEASRPNVSDATRLDTLEKSKEEIEKSLETAKSKNEEARAHSFAIQVYLALQLPEDDWYDLATDHFEDAIDLTPDDPAPYFFMGLADAKKLNYDQAEKMFDKVLSFAGQYEAEANQEMKRLQEIRRAMPGSQFGASIANVEKITRADVAALFIAELRLDKIYKERGNAGSGGFEAPKSQQKMKLDPLQKYPDAVDISGHPLEDSIKEVIRLGVKGLGPDPAHKFYPDQEFKRAEFAQLIQDLLIRITNDPSLATRFVGELSPFPDVNENVWYYNAVRTVVSRGLMTPNNKVTGEFEPMAYVRGADALLSIRALKEILKDYLR